MQTSALQKQLETALEDLLEAENFRDPFNQNGAVEFEGQETSSQERGEILMSRAKTKALEVLGKVGGKQPCQ